MKAGRHRRRVRHRRRQGGLLPLSRCAAAGRYLEQSRRFEEPRDASGDDDAFAPQARGARRARHRRRAGPPVGRARSRSRSARRSVAGAGSGLIPSAQGPERYPLLPASGTGRGSAVAGCVGRRPVSGAAADANSLRQGMFSAGSGLCRSLIFYSITWQFVRAVSRRREQGSRRTRTAKFGSRAGNQK